MKTIISGIVLALSLALTGCGSSGDDAPDIDAKSVVKEFEASAGQKISDMGDESTWHPYFKNAENRASDAITINLSMPGDVSDKEREDLAQSAGEAFFNFTGDKYQKLEQIVVFVDGLDTATVWRKDIPMLNK